MTFDFERIVSTLARHGVAYVLVGGAAAVAHGSTLPTEDVDVTPARDRQNLDRLAAALRELRARLRTSNEPEGVAFPVDGAFLAAMPLMVNLVTDAGDVDLTLAPSGFPKGYETLGPRAIDVDIGGVAVRVAALDDIITSKRAANRAKDRAALPYLEALADEIARGH
jgi:uncharacterized protein (DUF58 family)